MGFGEAESEATVEPCSMKVNGIEKHSNTSMIKRPSDLLAVAAHGHPKPPTPSDIPPVFGDRETRQWTVEAVFADDYWPGATLTVWGLQSTR